MSDTLQTRIACVTPDDLAGMLQVPRRKVLESITKQPGFPAPVSRGRYPRWLADEVQKFFRRQSKPKSAQISHTA